MNIDKIKKPLEKLGYSTFISHSNLIIGKNKGYDDELKMSIMDSFCIIEFKNNVAFIEYGQANIPLEKSFLNVKDAISFIKKEFPIQ